MELRRNFLVGVMNPDRVCPEHIAALILNVRYPS
jgi:hypothetical protein